MEVREERLNGAAVIEVCEQFVRLFWIKDIKDAHRKTFKNELLREFTGKLVIDFRRKGQAVLMNDMVGIISDDVNMMELKSEIIATHERSSRRTGTVCNISDSKIQLFDADTLKGKLTISFYPEQRKIMAQANPETLKHFVKFYGNAINKLHQNTIITRKEVISASQDWSTESTEFTLSQEQTEEDILLDEWHDIQTDINTPSTSEIPTNAAEGALNEEVSRLDKIDVNISEVSEPISQSDFVKFQQAFVADFREMREMMKDVLQKLPAITETTKRVMTLETKMADANAEIMKQQHEIKNLNSQLGDIRKSVSGQKSTAVGTAIEIGKISDGLSEVRQKLDAPPADNEGISDTIRILSERVGNLESRQAQRERTPDCASAEFKGIAEDLFSLTRTMESIESHMAPSVPTQEEVINTSSLYQPVASILPAAQEHPPTVRLGTSNDTAPVPLSDRSDDVRQTATYVMPSATTKGVQFNEQVILFVDSQFNNVKHRILKHGVSTRKVRVYTLTEAIAVMESATFAADPQQILFHLGTNDVDAHSPRQIADMLDYLLQLTRMKCPKARIYVSSVLPRTSAHISDIFERAAETSARFSAIINTYPGTFFINHAMNITIEMLADERHLNKEGFFIMLANIRFCMFGILPRSKRSR